MILQGTSKNPSGVYEKKESQQQTAPANYTGLGALSTPTSVSSGVRAREQEEVQATLETAFPPYCRAMHGVKREKETGEDTNRTREREN